ncbi:hypothetical protein M9458_010037, partial [Cirrhinus mrigala]
LPFFQHLTSGFPLPLPSSPGHSAHQPHQQKPFSGAAGRRASAGRRPATSEPPQSLNPHTSQWVPPPLCS